MTDTKPDIIALFHKYLKENNVTASFTIDEFNFAYARFFMESDTHFFSDYNMMNITYYAQKMNITLKPDTERSINSFYNNLYHNNSDSQYETSGFIWLYVICAIVFIFMMYKIIRYYRLRRRNHEDANNDAENKCSSNIAYNLIEEIGADEDDDNPSE